MIKVLATRLTQGADLKQSIMTLVQEHSITAGSIASCVGCLSQLNIRLADSTSTLSLQAPFEIVSLMGTLTPHHLPVADSQGNVWGGHLLDGNLINTTAELIVHGYPDLAFDREYDAHTGYTELTIQTK
ncbi:DNA-binding protein [Vibrio fluvialis]|jgi:hypothetical protein|nr:DNA-binding protein [Vibrio fluvialis]